MLETVTASFKHLTCYNTSIEQFRGVKKMSRLLAQGIILIQILKQDHVFSCQETLISLGIEKTFRKFISLNQ